MRHQAVMGVVAVACVAVVSAPMLGARGGVHHRGGRPADRHQYLAGVDFTADPVMAEAEATAIALTQAVIDPNALVFPKGPPTPPEDGVFSPFIGINPPTLGPLRSALRQLASLEQAPAETTPPASPPPIQPRTLIPAVVEETPDPPPIPPPPPEPPVTSGPPPPVIVVTPVTNVEPPPPETPPPADPPPAPVVVAQTFAEPPAPPTAVPEPGTWAMLLLGFGAIGAAIRRRRDRPVAEDCC